MNDRGIISLVQPLMNQNLFCDYVPSNLLMDFFISLESYLQVQAHNKRQFKNDADKWGWT